MTRKTTTRRRLVQGRDYHGWAWDDATLGGLFFVAHSKRPKAYSPTRNGRWVRVKFVRVGATKKRGKP